MHLFTLCTIPFPRTCFGRLQKDESVLGAELSIIGLGAKTRLDDLATNCSHMRWNPFKKQTSPKQLDAVV